MSKRAREIQYYYYSYYDSKIILSHDIQSRLTEGFVRRIIYYDVDVPDPIPGNDRVRCSDPCGITYHDLSHACVVQETNEIFF